MGHQGHGGVHGIPGEFGGLKAEQLNIADIPRQPLDFVDVEVATATPQALLLQFFRGGVGLGFDMGQGNGAKVQPEVAIFAQGLQLSRQGIGQLLASLNVAIAPFLQPLLDISLDALGHFRKNVAIQLTDQPVEHRFHIGGLQGNIARMGLRRNHACPIESGRGRLPV